MTRHRAGRETQTFSVPPRMPLILPLAFLVLQVFVLAWQPAFAYHVMVAAPLLCALALWHRSGREGGEARRGWRLLALSMLVWSAGTIGNLWFEWVQGLRNGMYREAILMFQLAPVPVFYLLAGEPATSGRRLVRLIDAVLALALCFSFFTLTWSLLTARGTPDEPGIIAMVWLLDVQNLFVAVCALARLAVAQSASERALLRALSIYDISYFMIVSFNNHFIAPREDLGAEVGSVVTLAFAAFAGFSLWHRDPPARQVPAMALRVVRSASPIVLAGTLIAVSLFLIRLDYGMGVAGVVLGVLGYGLRNTLTQVRQLAHGDTLERRQVELQALAWTDALTGAANRHFLEHALAETWRRAPPEGRLMTVLMLDIDHFKALNDKLGHASGDRCLREVAATLQKALVRPGDLLARYGGEEFTALLIDTDAEGGRTVAERLRDAVEGLHLPNPGGANKLVTVSIGGATGVVRTEADARQLLQAADTALYQAKSAGRNRVITRAGVLSDQPRG
ncbi:MAG TPA: GGDEF domain-containing protein [Burkholderiaceae bacterium]